MKLTNTDKLLEWLYNSESLEYDDEVKSKILKVIRKNKLKKFNK